MKIFLYRFCQCSWGFVQTFIGLVIFLFNIRQPRYTYKGAVVTEWKLRSSVSLGMFLFVARIPQENDRRRLLVHEYGHTIQSLILGPLYPFAVSIPSALWCLIFQSLKRKRSEKISYYKFYTESWANRLGERVTKEKTFED